MHAWFWTHRPSIVFNFECIALLAREAHALMRAGKNNLLITQIMKTINTNSFVAINFVVIIVVKVNPINQSIN